jgi:hypothetical protein
MLGYRTPEGLDGQKSHACHPHGQKDMTLSLYDAGTLWHSRNVRMNNGSRNATRRTTDKKLQKS